MSASWALISLVSVLGCSLWPCPSPAEEQQAEDETDLVVTEQGGVRYLSLRDWPMDRQGGVVTARPLEEYLSMKFGQVREQLSGIVERLEDIEQRLETLEVQQQRFGDRLARMESGPGDQEVDHGGTTQAR